MIVFSVLDAAGRRRSSASDVTDRAESKQQASKR
jgi:hypothetical protein